ncbi:MAG: hypothetical protein HUJ25_06425 [Crocinitomicaceae bacterium]|nr:hypothetical protein [Crocinitomicaceae bacterium]
MNNIVDLIIPLGFFAMTFGIVYVAVNAHHKSKMAMIEAGFDPRDEDEKQPKSPERTLKYAILLVLVPIGILVGRAIAPGLDLAGKHGSLIFAFLFAGIGLAIFYFIQKKKESNPVK